MEEKKELLHACGIDRVEVLPFDRSFAAMTAAEYLALLRDRFGATLVVMGYDNRIGSDMKTCAQLSEEGYSSQTVGCADSSLEGGSAPLLSPCGSRPISPSDTASAGCSDEHYYPTHTCHSERSEESHISSTAIRKALGEGRVEDANAMLGYEYGLYGVVVSGNQMGRTIGFPTANMQLYEPLKLVPANGVYAVEVEVLGRTLKGMCNIGLRPTVGGTTRTIETHILDFSEDIYGLPLRIRFLRRIRDERKFPSLDALKSQLHQDRLLCQ
jgi:riboflavin kinase/FMN adenylyltransferase